MELIISCVEVVVFLEVCTRDMKGIVG